jgi:hypothetical protein
MHLAFISQLFYGLFLTGTILFFIKTGGFKGRILYICIPIIIIAVTVFLSYSEIENYIAK